MEKMPMKYLLIENNKMPVIKETEDIDQLVNNLLNEGWIVENNVNSAGIYYIGGNGVVKDHPNRLMYVPDNPEYVEGYISHQSFIIVKKKLIKNIEIYAGLNDQEIKLYKQKFGKQSILETKGFFENQGKEVV